MLNYIFKENLTYRQVKQVRLDFVVTELGDAVQGRCHRDSLTVRRANDNSNLIPHLCGDNSGQHGEDSAYLYC